MGKRTNFVCSKCGKYEVGHREGRTECKICEGIYNKTWKKRTGKQSEYNKKIAQKRTQIKKVCAEYLGGSCQYTGDPGGCVSPFRPGPEICYLSFHFHHRDPETKLFDISRRLRNGTSIKGEINSIDDLRERDPQLIAELDKCILLCANCHHRLEYCDGCERKVAKERSLME